jgi:hypothetical protein
LNKKIKIYIKNPMAVWWWAGWGVATDVDEVLAADGAELTAARQRCSGKAVAVDEGVVAGGKDGSGSGLVWISAGFGSAGFGFGV